MATILGIAGSLRRASFNRGLLQAASELDLDGCTVEIGLIDDVPLYNGDDEAAGGLPGAVKRLQSQLQLADGLLLVTPEYNNGIPGVFKNAIDWMSRGDGLSIFRDKPVALIGASPGGFGTILSQAQWLPVLRTLRMRPWFDGRMQVSRAGNLFDSEGGLTDEATRNQLAEFMRGFAATL